jgi:hypothetical protein
MPYKCLNSAISQFGGHRSLLPVLETGICEVVILDNSSCPTGPNFLVERHSEVKAFKKEANFLPGSFQLISPTADMAWLLYPLFSRLQNQENLSRGSGGHSHNHSLFSHHPGRNDLFSITTWAPGD